MEYLELVKKRVKPASDMQGFGFAIRKVQDGVLTIQLPGLSVISLGGCILIIKITN
jgi:hypothetical protein